MKSFVEFRQRNDETSDALISEGVFLGMTVVASTAVIARTGSTIKTKISAVKATNDLGEKLDYLADAIEILSTRVTATAALVYASNK